MVSGVALTILETTAKLWRYLYANMKNEQKYAEIEIRSDYQSKGVDIDTEEMDVDTTRYSKCEVGIVEEFI